MKPSLFSLLVLFSFFTSLTTAKFLLDSQGEPIVNGASYYITGPIWPGPGGLDLAKTGNETCPFSIVQHPTSIFPDYGLPWTVTSSLKIRYIKPNTNVDFFSVEGKVPSCVPVPSKWTIVEEDGVKSVKISGWYKKTLREILGLPEAMMETRFWLSLMIILLLLCSSKQNHLMHVEPLLCEVSSTMNK
ncbi:kunitz-type elastase inhibitor BrEI-like [Prosopis cineraria]|uniref:kunitz-type elastase inhibitor BrEI-like n=1 Tax=Prosopis cineraria TaxID=364024 RepID=UPI00240F1DEB|nr:kunitz-type elastase inhibitor BrEI-like [Prosopis cineraria]